MGLYANTKSAKIAFFGSKTTPWNTSATAIGTTTTAVTALSTAVTNATAALAAQVTAVDAAKTATATADNAVAIMVLAGANIIKDIRAKAYNSADPQTVYTLAQIPAPATRTPVSTLGEPTMFAVTLGNTGSPTTTWKCSSPRASGVVYQIYRKLDSDADYVYQGGTGEKKWTDSTIPSGTTQVNYKLQAVRSTAAGPWGVFTITFGTGSGGAVIASVRTAPKLAA